MGAAARFNFPSGVAVDGTGNVYVADFWNNTVRKVTPTGVVTTVVGVPGRSGTLPGPLPASLNAPWGVAVEPTTGDLFIVADAAVLKVNL
jgi:DNA-binding beta-propeller fold protein YncE